MARTPFIALVALLAIGLTACSSGPDYSAFAQCLTDQQVVMYGSYRCPHCTNQKKLFGSGFKNIKYIECDPSSRAAQLNLCEAAGVTSWPTWVLPDGEKLVGETSLETLAEKTSCSLPSLTPTEGESTSMIDQTAPADEAAEPVTN